METKKTASKNCRVDLYGSLLMAFSLYLLLYAFNINVKYDLLSPLHYSPLFVSSRIWKGCWALAVLVVTLVSNNTV